MIRKGSAKWKLVEAVLGKSDMVLLFGKPTGTGKSWAAQHIGLKKDQKVYNITCCPEMSSAELRGHYLPKGNEFVFHYGVGSKAWLEGARLVLEEIDKVGGDVETFLHGLLDTKGSAEITLPNGETIRPHKNFQCVATMNGSPASLIQPIRNRFPVQIEILENNPDALLVLSEDLRDAAARTVSVEESRHIDFRFWLAFDKLRKDVEEDLALQAIFGDRAQDIKNEFLLRL